MSSAFAKMRDAFVEAQDSRVGGRWQSACRFAGREARIRVVGSGCAETITAPFRHVLLENSTKSLPELTIDIWDARETGTEFPGHQTESDQVSSEYGLITGDATSRFFGCHRPGMLSWMDRSSQHIVACTADSRHLELYERAKPLLFPLMMWHCDHDVEIIHSAFVEDGGQGVLFAGQGGAGKSTAALTCLEAGFKYLGDDYIGLQGLDNGSFIGHSVYNTAWMEPDHARSFPALLPHVAAGTLPKLPVVLSDVYPQQIGTSAEIRFILLPRLFDGPSCRVRPAHPGETLLALAPSSLIKRPCSGASGFDKIARLVEQVPSYFIEIGSDLSDLPTLVREILSSGAEP